MDTLLAHATHERGQLRPCFADSGLLEHSSVTSDDLPTRMSVTARRLGMTDSQRKGGKTMAGWEPETARPQATVAVEGSCSRRFPVDG